MKRRAACRRGAGEKKRCTQGRNIYSTKLFYYTRNQKSTLFLKKIPPRLLRFPSVALPLQTRTLLTVECADYRADTPYSAAARAICVAVCAICVAVIKMSAGAAARGAHTQKRRRIKMRRRKKFGLKNMPENKLYYFFTARLHFTLHRALLRAPPLQTGKPPRRPTATQSVLPQNYVAAHPPLKQAGENCKACSNVDIAHGYTFGSFELNGGKV